MKFRRRPAPFLLLLLPAIATALAVGNADSSETSLIKNTATLADRADPITIPSPLVDLNTKSKYEIGTKDAPVDGKDGKPHAGPFVGTEKDNKKDTKPDAKKTPLATKDGQLIATDDHPKIVGPDGGAIPQSNDGVMDDPHRQLPKQGTTGTEGGVSEKDKTRKAQEGQTGEKLEKKPDSPKEAPPLPHSEQTKLNSEKAKTEKTKGEKTKDEKTKVDKLSASDDELGEGLGGLEKPNGLPSKPNNLPHPLPNSANKDHLDISKPDSKSSPTYLKDPEVNEGLIQPLHSFLLSLTMILFSEVGDKTFLIAALMAMKHDRMLVFSAALSALITMTILSAVLGHTLPTLIPKRYTNFLAAGLFLVFGVRLLREGLAMSPDEGVGAEMKEVELELEEKENQAKQQGRRRSSISPYALEMGLGARSASRKSRSGSRLPSLPRSPSSSPERSPAPTSSIGGALRGVNNLFSLLLSPAWVQTFVMTFLGEWGDRSQIATIAMAAGQDYWWVTGGAISGHAVCTGVAVIGGRAIAGRVSMRVVTLGGAIAFLIFGVIYLAEALYYG